MDIATLNAFISVARHESFSKASEHLFLTQPAISKRVAALEEELGAQLFNRIARRISLTEAGKQLLPKARELVNQAEDMQRYATNLSQEISGNLSIAISHHIGLHRMPPIFKEFNQHYPTVNLDIRFEDSDQAFHAVEQGDIEFAIITLPKNIPKQLKKEVIWHDELAIVVANDHPLSQVSNQRFSDLSNYQCVLPSSDTETFKIMQREFDQQGLTLNVQMQTNNLETLKMLVVAGLGWSLLPKTMLDNSLTKLTLSDNLQRELGVVLHKKRSLSNAATALKGLLVS